MKEAILYLVRFFDKEEHADQFMKGQLYLRRLRYYKRLEAYRDGRADYAEAPAGWLQKHDVRIEFHDHPELNIQPENLAGPVLLSFDYHNDLHILCMTAIHTGEFDFDCESGLILDEGDEDKLRKQLEIDSRCFEMGSFAVMARGLDFILRARTAIETRGHTCESALVNYFDPTTFHGRFPSLSSQPFRKRNTFSYQNEYRFCVNTHAKGDDVLCIEIGDISDFAAKMPAEAVNTVYQLHLEKFD